MIRRTLPGGFRIKGVHHEKKPRLFRDATFFSERDGASDQLLFGCSGAFAAGLPAWAACRA